MKHDTSHCISTEGATRVRKAAERFPQKLEEAHQGKIVLRDSAIYRGRKSPIDVKCTVCGWEWKPQGQNLIYKKQGCPKCANLRNAASAGTKRCPRASDAEKELARRMRKTGMSYVEISNVLGRSESTIMRWLNPEYREKERQRSAKTNARDRKSGKKSELRKNYGQTPHGKQSSIKSFHKRRSLQYHCSGLELIDGVWVENDLWSYVKGDQKGCEIMSFDGADDAIAFRKKQCESFKRWSGEEYHVDHIIPLSKGGIHHPLNFQNLPAAVNVSKQGTIRDKDVSLFCKRLFNL